MLNRTATFQGGRGFLRRRFERQCKHEPVTEKVMTGPEIPISFPCQSGGREVWIFVTACCGG